MSTQGAHHGNQLLEAQVDARIAGVAESLEAARRLIGAGAFLDAADHAAYVAHAGAVLRNDLVALARGSEIPPQQGAS